MHPVAMTAMAQTLERMKAEREGEGGRLVAGLGCVGMVECSGRNQGSWEERKKRQGVICFMNVPTSWDGVGEKPEVCWSKRKKVVKKKSRRRGRARMGKC